MENIERANVSWTWIKFVLKIDFIYMCSDYVPKVREKMSLDQIGKMVGVYIDDIILQNPQVGDYLKYLEEAFNILRKYRMNLNMLKYSFGVKSRKFHGYIVNQWGIVANRNKIQALIRLRSF